MKRGDKPYKSLGQELLRIRKRIQESIAEVSGAVEITDEQLSTYEEGTIRPAEDILQLIISHFNLKDEESDALWDLAGYEEKQPPLVQEDVYTQHPAIMVMPMDSRIVYSDSYQVSINQYGVVMTFLQNNGQNVQQVPVARVGMSIDHAKRIVETLQQTIKTATEIKSVKNLPPHSNDDQNSKK